MCESSNGPSCTNVLVVASEGPLSNPRLNGKQKNFMLLQRVRQISSAVGVCVQYAAYGRSGDAFVVLNVPEIAVQVALVFLFGLVMVEFCFGSSSLAHLYFASIATRSKRVARSFSRCLCSLNSIISLCLACATSQGNFRSLITPCPAQGIRC